MPNVKRAALLDDYQNVVLGVADWQSLRPAVEVVAFQDHLTDEDALAKRLQSFEIVVAMRDRTRISRALLEKLPRLEFIIQTGLSNASIDLDAATELGILVSHTLSVRHTTTELTWALILGALRHVPEEDRAIRDGKWQVSLGQGVFGKTLGLLGVGQIGAEVARVGRAFGMEVVGWSQNLDAAKAAAAGVRRVDKDDLFRLSDVLSVHLILSPRTRDLVGARELGLMKRSALLVNTSRRPIVNEPALIAALRNGTIAGAALDVFDVEPPPPGHPLRSLPNALVTPHIGHVTRENYAHYFPGAVEDIRAYLDGQPIRVLNPAVLGRQRGKP
jgi:phosphoglycerate dehydrogenase-like enzyme